MNILITGGSSGLGKAIVERLLNDERNHILFTYYRHSEEAVRLTGMSANIQAFKCNFCDEEDVERLIEEIALYKPDVLVNNAYVGFAQGKHFHKTSSADFEESFRYNLIPTIRITQACINEFKKRKFGKIINILTTALLNLPPIGYAIYASNKAYLQQLSKSWNTEYSKYNITANCVSPEFMQTNLSAEVDERVVEQLSNSHPLHCLLTPQEVAETVTYFVYASQQINGVNIPINAGQDIIK
ncbi:MAG: SDR family oxidoreductase [Odoribacter sp.]